MQPGFPNCDKQPAASLDATHDESFERTLIDRFGTRNYDAFVRNHARFCHEHDVLHVLVDHSFLMELLQSRYREPLLDAARSVYGPAVVLQFELMVASTAKPPHKGDPGAGASGDLRGETTPRLGPGTLPLPTARTPGGTPLPANASNVGRHEPENAARTQRRLARLDEFVDGPGARTALAAALDFVGRDPGDRGTLYVFGPTGTGKTHLLEGIVHALRRQSNGEQPLLLTAEQFTNLFTSALRSHGLPAFRQKLRGADVLLIDDVDFLDGKPRVQEEFLHTLQQLESSGRRCVLAADRHPRLLSRTRPELQTRYLAGTTCRIEPPDQATREQIVARKALTLGMMLPPEAARVIAQKVRTSVRELEGALYNLRNLHRVSGQPVNVSLARQVVSEIERDCVRVVRLPDIERVVCETFGVTVEDLRSARRTRTISEPRMLAMFLARRHTRAAYAEIGAYFGGRNHATVMSAEKKVQSSLDKNDEMVVSIQPWRMSDLVQALEQQLLAS